MNLSLSHARRMLAPLALSAALLALPGLASAGAVTSATAVALFDPVDADPGIDVTYQFNTADTVSGTRIRGNAIASALQTPNTNIAEELFFQDQDAQSQAEAYKTGKMELGSASAAISNEAYVMMENTTGTDGNVTLGWEYMLEAIQQVTGIHSFASAYAYAEILMFDDFFDFYLQQSVQALYDGDQHDGDQMAKTEDGGEVTLFVPANGSNLLTIQLITEADAQFVVPAPATIALLAFGLIGMTQTLRRRRV
jgi:hypothetical protein